GVLFSRARALAALAATRRRLEARRVELATLHAFGREILSTRDPAKVFAVVDRECRKVLAVDVVFLALLDPETHRIRASYRTGGGASPVDLAPDGQGLADRVAREGRVLRLDDVGVPGASSPLRGLAVAPGIHAVLAVPLLLDDRVAGVLSAQSRTPLA